MVAANTAKITTNLITRKAFSPYATMVEVTTTNKIDEIVVTKKLTVTGDIPFKAVHKNHYVQTLNQVKLIHAKSYKTTEANRNDTIHTNFQTKHREADQRTVPLVICH